MKSKRDMTYCQDCLRFVRNECESLKTAFPLWSEKDQAANNFECWSKQTSREAMIKELETMKEFYALKNGDKTEEVRRINNRISKLESELEAERKAAIYADLHEVYEEEVHRGKGGGGGEKADRTNKSFGPQQMKNNKFAHRKNNPKKYSEW